MVIKRLSDEEKSRFSKLLSHWFYSQNQYKLKDFSSEVGIPYDTIYGYLKMGKRPDIYNANIIINFIKNHSNLSSSTDEDILSTIKTTENSDIREKKVENKVIYQIDELNDLLNNLQSSIKDIQEQISSKKPSDKKSQNIELYNHTNNLKSSLFSLYSELMWFKNQTKNERKILRKNISVNDIGYMTSLLRAIIKGEDAFNDWILATNYQMEMLRWQ